MSALMVEDNRELILDVDVVPPADVQVVAQRKSMAAAVALSLLWPGLGHLYVGRYISGALLAFTCLLTFGVMGRFTSAINAAVSVRRFNRTLDAVAVGR